MKYEVSIIFTLYNKECEIEEAVKQIHAYLRLQKMTHEFILCNDGSSDSTLYKCEQMKHLYEHLKVLSYKNNIGRGYAVRLATKQSMGNNIFYFDSDIVKTTPLKYITHAIESLKDFDLLIADRFNKENFFKRKFHRKIISNIQRVLQKIIFPEILDINDTEAGFKGGKSKVFKELVALTNENRWGLDLELILLAKKHKYSICQLPIQWNEKHEDYTSSVKFFRDIFLQCVLLVKLRFK